MTKYSAIHNPNGLNTPQNEKISEDQILNNAGGYVFKITPWQQFERFLILGSENGTYYVSAKTLTRDNCKNLIACIKSDGIRAVDSILEISNSGRAPKNAPAIYALALAAVEGNLDTKKKAFSVLSKVARTSTDLFSFVQQYKAFGGGFGSVAKKGIQAWYQNKDVSNLAHQIVKYRQRDGWTHHDVLHLSHPKAKDNVENNLFAFAKSLDDKKAKYDEALLPNIAVGFLKAQSAKTEKEVSKIITEFSLPREAIPTEFLNSPDVWDALLTNMPATALIRNLGKMTNIGLIDTMSNAEKLIVNKLTNAEWLKKSRIHPMNVLAAMKVYSAGRGVKGSLTWNPSQRVINALDSAFYGTFSNVEATGKNIHIGLDISGSMFGSTVLGFDFMTAAEASAAMALILTSVEENVFVGAFTTNYREIDLHRKMRLDDVLKLTSKLAREMGGTDCALPMLWSMTKNIKQFDSFIILTDNETWAGRNGHPSEALKKYRKFSGRNTKMIVGAMTASNASIADPNDSGMIDIVGCDSNVPVLVRDFIAN